MAKSLATLLQEAGQRLEKFDFGSALHLYQQAMAAAPHNAAAAMGMALTLNRTGRPADALTLLQKIWGAMSVASPKPSPTQQASVLAQIALAHEQLGKMGDALEAYRQAARLVRSDELRHRIKQLEPLVSSSPPVQQLILNGRRLHNARQYEEAAKTFQGALRIQSDNAEVLHGLALALRALKQSTEAMPLLQKAIILVPDRADYYNDLGLLFQDRLDFAKAVSFHKRAIKVDPRFISAWINLGVAHKRLGRLEDAASAYAKALEINPRSPEAHNNLGNLMRIQGQLVEARNHLRRALALAPTYEDAKSNLAEVTKAIADSRKPPPPPEVKPKSPRKVVAKKKPAKVIRTAKPARAKK
ncbi:tetratricopeptide repeat protein [Caenimonas aquaedulcis]|uniref:Tetratricopeptide repeat protein n=1 Tax=Caenimonas aquaedulcis TaxID=2793270 RepID=A0A931MGW0_9BURK|nr:tetratricopeptide repeat protein [Caenimonas aquaedulcis]MBG9388189.1 tetratricopeptide repeat protein [Caenimonas aquaedulcis]